MGRTYSFSIIPPAKDLSPQFPIPDILVAQHSSEILVTVFVDPWYQTQRHQTNLYSELQNRCPVFCYLILSDRPPFTWLTVFPRDEYSQHNGRTASIISIPYLVHAYLAP
jgi:hypothetical protein